MARLRGQSLFEVVFAVSIAAVIIIGVLSLVPRLVSNSDFSKNNALATKYALESTEWIRQQRDKETWNTFYSRASDSPGSDYCLENLNWGSFPCGFINNIFERTVNLTQVTVTQGGRDYLGVEAKVRVRWTDGSGTHEVLDVSRYFNWNL